MLQRFQAAITLALLMKAAVAIAARRDAAQCAGPFTLSRLPAEASAGVWCWPIEARTDAWPFKNGRGELVFCATDNALGFRLPGGLIVALNDPAAERIGFQSDVWVEARPYLRRGRGDRHVRTFLRELLPLLPTSAT